MKCHMLEKYVEGIVNYIENIYKTMLLIEYMNLRDKDKYDTIIILSDICKMEEKI